MRYRGEGLRRLTSHLGLVRGSCGVVVLHYNSLLVYVSTHNILRGSSLHASAVGKEFAVVVFVESYSS